MFRRAAFSAVAALTVGVLAVGCNEDGDTIVSGGGVARPGNFPGSQVDASNVAADARAMTPPDEDIVDGPEVFWNNANGHAIILYETQPAAGGGSTSRNLMAHWFDGSRVHPGVQIRGLRGGAVEEVDGALVGYKAMFLNPTGNANANAAARVGDAIILFTRHDEAPVTPGGATVHEDSNIRLWGTYFDLSAASAPASGTVIGGFDTAASVLDNDNVIDAVTNDPDVDTFGFVSDALRYTHQFDGASEEVDSGDVTNFVYFIYGKNQQSGAGAAVINRYRFLTFDMTQATNAMPTAGGTDLTVGTGAYQAGQGADIAGPVLVHSNALIWNSAAVGADSDAVVTVSVFNQNTTGGGVATTFALGETPVTGGTADNTFMPAADNFYGRKHGLNAFYAIYEADGYSTGAAPTTAGDRNPDRDMLVTMWPDVATPTPERLEIDAHQGTAVLTGNDQRIALGGVVASSIQTRIDRSGNYIAAIWLQRGTDLSTSGGNNTLTTNVLWARSIQTRRGTSARTLANSVSTAGPLNAPSLGTGVVTTGTAQADVNNVRFQEDLARGQTVAQGAGFADRGCSFQGNNLRMNFIYQQLNDQGGTGTVPAQRRLSVNGMVVTLGATDADRPSQALVSATEVTIETVHQAYAGTNPITARAYDAGDNSRTTATPPVATTSAGRPIVFFASNDNTKTDSGANGAFPELRLYAWESNTVTTVSTNPTGTTSDLFQLAVFQGAVPVPVNEDTTNSPSHVGNRLHAYWTEQTIDGTSRDLATRSYDLTRTQPATGTAPALAERFVPATTAEPVFIDNRGGSNLLAGLVTGTTFSVVRSGSTVGVFFVEGRRLFYQQTSTDANGYYKNNGLVTPELVDNESDNPVLSVGIASPNRCDNLSRTIAFFTKRVTTTGNNVARGQVRVLN